MKMKPSSAVPEGAILALSTNDRFVYMANGQLLSGRLLRHAPQELPFGAETDSGEVHEFPYQKQGKPTGGRR